MSLCCTRVRQPFYHGYLNELCINVVCKLNKIFYVIDMLFRVISFCVGLLHTDTNLTLPRYGILKYINGLLNQPRRTYQHNFSMSLFTSYLSLHGSIQNLIYKYTKHPCNLVYTSELYNLLFTYLEQ